LFCCKSSALPISVWCNYNSKKILNCCNNLALPTVAMEWKATTEVKLKVKLSLNIEALRHEGICGNGCIDRHFLDLGTSWRWVVRFTPRQPYTQVRSLGYPLDRRLGGHQRWPGQRENSYLHRHFNSDPSVVQPLASRCTDYAISVPGNYVVIVLYHVPMFMGTGIAQLI
jgi:hypothetical protein